VKDGARLKVPCTCERRSVRKAGLAERWVRLDVLFVLGETLWPIPNAIGLVGRVPSFEIRKIFSKKKIFFSKKNVRTSD